MSFSYKPKEILATGVRIEQEMFYVLLKDGREIGVPYDWYWRLHKATPQQRLNWELIADGYVIHWPDIDDDVSVEAILNGERMAK